MIVHALPTYPPAERLPLVDVIHGRPVADPYRWLEDPLDPRTVEWSSNQDALFSAHQASWSGRPRLREQIAELFDVGEVFPPFWCGDRSFTLRRDPGQEHAVLVAADPDGTERILVDPMAIDPTGTTTLDMSWPSI